MVSSLGEAIMKLQNYSCWIFWLDEIDLLILNIINFITYIYYIYTEFIGFFKLYRIDMTAVWGLSMLGLKIQLKINKSNFHFSNMLINNKALLSLEYLTKYDPTLYQRYASIALFQVGIQ